jgi:uncharacterized protein (TIGR02145 family)
MNLFNRQLLAQLFAAVVIGAVCLSGCGEDVGGSGSNNNPGNTTNNGNGNNTNNVTKADISGYRTVTIGNQTWMAENLNHKTGNSWCYDDNTSNCDEYGRLYDWETAMNVCPSSWHLPTTQEWKSLVEYAGGNTVSGGKLKATTGWDDVVSGGFVRAYGNGTNDYEFSALPGGFRCSVGDCAGVFAGIGTYGSWWSATAATSGVYTVWYYEMTYQSGIAHENFNFANHGRSVRCVMN